MSKLFAIIAYDEFYGGYHGITDAIVTECESYQEAADIGRELSEDLIYQYDIPHDAGWYDTYSDDPEGFAEELENDIAFNIYELKDNITESIEFLTEKLNEDKEEFISKYCEIN